MRTLCLSLVAIAFLMTSCSKEDDVLSVETGDVFTFSTLRNKTDISGWKFENGTVVEMTAAEIATFITEESVDVFEDDEIVEGDTEIEITSGNAVKVTMDGDVLDGTYAINGENLTVTVAEQGFAFTFPFILEDNSMTMKSYSSYEGNPSDFSFYSSGNIWIEGTEETLKSMNLMDEGDHVLYMYYEFVYNKK
ncbi:MAG: hypothetical protein AAFP19_05675 [Bacteroidota bacterium]